MQSLSSAGPQWLCVAVWQEVACTVRPVIGIDCCAQKTQWCEQCGRAGEVCESLCELCKLCIRCKLVYRCCTPPSSAAQRASRREEPRRPELDGSSARAFRHERLVLQPDVIRPEDRDALVAAFERLFKGDFDTAVFPDEWHWREGISKPDAFREMRECLEKRRRVAAVALDAAIGKRAAELMGWRGARLAQDDVLWKPPGAQGSYHTDGKYISDNFVPRDDNSVTVWIALDAADEATGVVEYARGSHRWPRAATTRRPRSTTAPALTP